MVKLKEIVDHLRAEFLDEEICLIKDFLDADEVESLLRIAQNATPEDWGSYSFANKSQWFNSVMVFKDPIGHTLASKVQQVFKNNMYHFEDVTLLRRRQNDQGLEAHFDNQVEKTCELGIVFYLNDDYDGGEIYYPNRGLNHKPLKNSLVIHSASQDYMHGVKPVSGNPRYFITLWAYVGDNKLGF